MKHLPRLKCSYNTRFVGAPNLPHLLHPCVLLCVIGKSTCDDLGNLSNSQTSRVFQECIAQATVSLSLSLSSPHYSHFLPLSISAQSCLGLLPVNYRKLRAWMASVTEVEVNLSSVEKLCNPPSEPLGLLITIPLLGSFSRIVQCS